MLTQEDIKLNEGKYAACGQARFDTLEDARAFCRLKGLTDEDHGIIESRNQFYVEREPGLIRSFETDHKIAD